MTVQCPHCGWDNNCFYDTPTITCYLCNASFTYERFSTPGAIAQEELPALAVGTIIKIINREHPWFDDIGIVREKRHRHCRVELHGQLVWMPTHWIQQHECS